MTVNKRPLPPTPTTNMKYINVNDAVQSLLLDTHVENLSERELRWFTDLTHCHKALEQKDSVIGNLKTIVLEWKKKAIDYENAYKNIQQKLEDREQFLLKQHQAEIEAITKSQTEQVNEHLELILELEKENQTLKTKEQQQQQQQQQQQLPNSNIQNDIYTSSTMQLCNEAQVANQLACESALLCNKDNSEHLIQSINEMVNAMEGTLDELQNNNQYYNYGDLDAMTTLPGLIFDSSYSSSDESTTDLLLQQQELQQQQQQQQQQTSKRKSIRSSFLFRGNNSKKNQDNTQQPSKRVHILNEAHRFHRKPTRTNSPLTD